MTCEIEHILYYILYYIHALPTIRTLTYMETICRLYVDYM